MRDTRSVVIVGANLAGMSAARALAGELSAVVYEPAAMLEWLPNIHELLSGLKRPYNLRIERGPLLARAGHDWRRQRVTRIDSHRHCIELDDGSEQLFSRVIVAVGGVHKTHGVPGAEQFALPFKSVADCQRIAVRLAALASSGATMRVVIVGAGIEGIEAAGEILRRYRSQPGLSLALVDSAPRLLANLPAVLDETLRAHCQQLPVSLHLGQRVAQVSEHAVMLANGETLPADLVLWTGGVGPHPLLAASHLSGSDGFAAVTQALHSDHGDGVYLAGDAITSVGGVAIAQQAYHAMAMGAHAARNVLAMRHGRPLQPWQPGNKPQLITFGDIDAFLVQGERVLASPALGWLKEGIYQAGMASFDRRRGDRRLSVAWRRLQDSLLDNSIDLLRQPSWRRLWAPLRRLPPR